jgi:cytochrome b
MLSRRSAWYLLAAGIFQWIVWPTFLKNIWGDPRSFDSGPTGFLVVHAVLTAVQLVLATGLLALGWRGLRRRQPSSTT